MNVFNVEPDKVSKSMLLNGFTLLDNMMGVFSHHNPDGRIKPDIADKLSSKQQRRSIKKVDEYFMGPLSFFFNAKME